MSTIIDFKAIDDVKLKTSTDDCVLAEGTPTKDVNKSSVDSLQFILFSKMKKILYLYKTLLLMLFLFNI